MYFYLALILGAISILFGVLFIVKPTVLVKLNEIGNKVISIERTVILYPRIFGAVMLILAVYMMYRGWEYVL